MLLICRSKESVQKLCEATGNMIQLSHLDMPTPAKQEGQAGTGV